MDYNVERAKINKRRLNLEEKLQEHRRAINEIEDQITRLFLEHADLEEREAREDVYQQIQKRMHDAIGAEFKAYQETELTDEQALEDKPVLFCDVELAEDESDDDDYEYEESDEDEGSEDDSVSVRRKTWNSRRTKNKRFGRIL
jgi:hypothetical protein